MSPTARLTLGSSVCLEENKLQGSGDSRRKGCHFPRAVRTLLKCRAQNRFISLQRYERLEDQLHDLTDLHQHETANLKQQLASIEEKVAYQAYERSRDIQVPFLPPPELPRALPSRSFI